MGSERIEAAALAEGQASGRRGGAGSGPAVPIRLHDTARRRKVVLEPIDPDNVRMYVCGPTVYDRAHLGNARPAVVFDTLFRLLRHVRGPEHVTYVRNITDVDDKINARALQTGRSIEQITEETIAWYHEDMDALGVLRPTHEPRATAFVGRMIEMIGCLVERGHAYVAEGHVLFAVESWPEYGRLSGRAIEDMIAGARVEVAPYKRNPMDFVLWKPSPPDLPGWDSPWGRGRPGWHIECSAMAATLLGETFDIHGGGNDLMFPHHENELAQSRACGHGFARIWMHNEMLQVEGRKMSKSLGNFFTVRDLLDEGIPGEVIRLVLLSTHYRKPMDWTAKKAREAGDVLRRWRRLTEGAAAPAGGAEGGLPPPDSEVVAALADDLNTPRAIARLHELARGDEAALLLSSARLLGLLESGRGGWAEGAAVDPEVAALVERLLAERARARQARDWARADALRAGLAEAGVIVRDRPGAEAEWELGPDFDRARLASLA